MQAPNKPIDSVVPYFPFRLRVAENNGGFLTGNHLTAEPVRLNRQAAEVLRLADGETPFTDIVARLAQRYAAAEKGTIRDKTWEVLRELSADELIWWRAVPMQAIAAGPPRTVFLEITAACNLRCLHCVVGAGKRQPGELATARWLELIEELAEFGVHSVAFSGGEPLIHPQFKQLMGHARRLGLAAQVSTNGTLVTPVLAGWLKDHGVGIQVSLDGSRSEIHDHMRPGSEAYKKTIAGIEALVAAGHRIVVGTVVSTFNLADIPHIVALCERLGVASFRLIPFVPQGRGQSHQDMEITPEQRRELTRYLRDYRKRASIDVVDMEFEEMLDGTSCLEPLTERRRMGCDGAIGYATITPTGELLPCHFFSGVRADSVASSSFSEVWQRSRFLTYFRHLDSTDLHGACHDCLWLDRCGGSCRAVNFASGDIFGGNPQCWLAEER